MTSDQASLLHEHGEDGSLNSDDGGEVVDPILGDLVLHANWTGGRLWLWAESVSRIASLNGADDAGSAEHPFAVDPLVIQESLTPAPAAAASDAADDAAHTADDDRDGDDDDDDDEGDEDSGPITWFGTPETISIRLPALRGELLPSPQCADLAEIDVDDEHTPALQSVLVPAIPVDSERLLPLMLHITEVFDAHRPHLGHAVRYYSMVGRFIAHLLVRQRFVPTLSHRSGTDLQGAWRLWLHDDDAQAQLAKLARCMPASARAAIDDFEHDPARILDDMFARLADAAVRRFLAEDGLIDAVNHWRNQEDLHVAWLKGLLARPTEVEPPGATGIDLLRGVREWLGRLHDVGQDQPFHLCLVLEDPTATDNIEDLTSPGGDCLWRLTFHLQASDDDEAMLDAERIWTASNDVQFVQGRRIDHPQEVLLAELARASKVFPSLEQVLEAAAPTGFDLTTSQAHTFMRHATPLLVESGVAVILPDWWHEAESRLSARLRIESDELGEDGLAAVGLNTVTGQTRVGLESLVSYSWQIAVGDQALSEDEFKRLAEQESPLVRFQGRWVEIRRDDINKAMEYIKAQEEGQVSVREALRMAFGSSRAETGLPVLGMDATGWVGQLFGASTKPERMPLVPQPGNFRGTLRPYQVNGLSWLGFLQRFGFGACLADDMGLGKTIQFIALLQWEREQVGDRTRLGPSLLVVPTSVVNNWVRELKKFGPELKVMVHHGIERVLGERLIEEAKNYDVIVTTYSLVYRDLEDLGKVEWWRVCLDEAQNIKNPSAKQTTAIRSLNCRHRLALTGTPVENRLSELWSIMEFVNPGHLGSPHEFRKDFAIPIERHRDDVRTRQLRDFVQPFVLRRVKTDPHVIADLPDKIEQKLYTSLTDEQVRLYEKTVQDMMTQVERAEGIQRRGLVLATLIRLKQICNHPEQYWQKDKGRNSSSKGSSQSNRSGKATRLKEMLDVIVAEGDSALVFTQFREMGHILERILRTELDIDVIFLHGGTPTRKRQQMIDRFQLRDGTAPVFLLSLKAGGFGLNLTAANHVFHFDRWWNPAVEDQATDRAFRIGQTRNVQVHKFVCAGTLEERIDQMLEQKTELAKSIIGQGEHWLTELSTSQLREIIAFREDTTDFDFESDDDSPVGARSRETL